MQAIVYKKYGPPDVLQLKEIEKPIPKDNEILIKVHAAEVTKSDCEMRSFKFAVKWFWLPLRLALGITKPRRQILGGYFAGEVEAVGKNVLKFQSGDQVFGCAGLRMGCYSEFICLPDNYTIVSKPNNINFAQAAAVPLGGLNALHFMKKANILSGQTVLINGAGGSIGTFAVMLAKHMGAQVTAVDSAIKEGMLRRIGADHFIDYNKNDFTKSGKSYDVIFDMVSGNSYSACVNTLKPKGCYLMANPRLSDMLRSVITSNFTHKNVIFAFAGEKEAELLELKQMIEQEKIEAIVDKVYPMDQVVQAHRRVETEQRLGPVVLSLVS
ncbi:MAG: NAD(P)-dependent alcohol dehydrogenase [Saccharospirillaceae bacterium]|nr:NAD(P)-dependent alcohol dehydrogenase [Pseudomonadales bacterium]NRB81261.1 NAD(P)-dependent alcohol dehydrogenase [Saccharospirillaceae bacterium]